MKDDIGVATYTLAMATRDDLKPYLCYIHRAGRSIAELTVIACENERCLARAVDAMGMTAADFLRIEVYDGERRVMVRHGRAAAA